MEEVTIKAYEFDKLIHKSIEYIESVDWNINDTDDGHMRYNKSINAYYMNNWYEKVKEITFPTYFYNSLEDIPDILPFSRSMVRYEHKSPSDSEYWGPVSTKKELKKIFYTSLVSRAKPGKIYCVREWKDMEEVEYRCIWNNYLTAISSDHEIDIDMELLLKLTKYVRSIEPFIPFTKCIFDIGILKETKEFILIEFNSWETLSRPHYFNWVDHTEYLYNTNGMTSVRTNSHDDIIQIKYGDSVYDEKFYKIDVLDIKILEPTTPSGWLLHKDYLYVMNDIWLQKIRLSDMVCIRWKRGVFRFAPIILTEKNTILVGNYELDLEFRVLKNNMSNVNNVSYDKLLGNKYRYGFRGKLNSSNIFCRVDQESNFNCDTDINI